MKSILIALGLLTALSLIAAFVYRYIHKKGIERKPVETRDMAFVFDDELENPTEKEPEAKKEPVVAKLRDRSWLSVNWTTLSLIAVVILLFVGIIGLSYYSQSNYIEEYRQAAIADSIKHEGEIRKKAIADSLSIEQYKGIAERMDSIDVHIKKAKIVVTPSKSAKK